MAVFLQRDTRIRLDTTLLPPEQSFSAWQRAVVGFHVTRPPAEEGLPFVAKVDGYGLGAMALLHASLHNPLRFVGPLAPGQPQNYSFVLILEGTLEGRIDDHDIHAGPGQIIVFDWRRVADVSLAPSTTLSLIVPQAALNAEFGDLPDLHGKQVDGPAGRFLTDYLLSLESRLHSSKATEVGMLYKATQAIVGASIAALPVERLSPDPVRGGAIRANAARLIDAQLGENLTPATVAAQLGIARTTLYRAFESSGGVAGYIQARRLEAAHAVLCRLDEIRSIKSIARSFGFSSPQAFNKAFRRRFGYSPRDAREGAELRPRPGTRVLSRPEEQLYDLVARRGPSNL